MKPDYDMRYSILQLKKVYKKNEIALLIIDAQMIIFFSKNGSKGVVVTTAGILKIYPSDLHTEFKIEEIKGALI